MGCSSSFPRLGATPKGKLLLFPALCPRQWSGLWWPLSHPCLWHSLYSQNTQIPGPEYKEGVSGVVHEVWGH